MPLILLLLVTSMCYGYSPVSPSRQFEPKLMALTVYGEHSGQSLFEEKFSAMSVLNTAGLQVNMSPLAFLQLGIYLGVAEFDHNGAGENQDQIFNSNF